jgi:hypothetical protein
MMTPAAQPQPQGIGDNRPPLADQLDMELEEYRAAVDAHIGSANQSSITDHASAEAVRLLAGKISALDKTIAANLELRVRPHQDNVDIIRRKFNALLTPLGTAYKSLRDMMIVYVRQQDAEAARKRAAAEAEARRIAEEARKAQEAAAKAQEEARKAQEEASRLVGQDGERLPLLGIVQKPNNTGANLLALQKEATSANLLALQKEEEAAAAALRAAAIRPEPIRTALGSASTRRDIKFEIENLTQALAWLRAHHRTAITEVANGIINRHLRSLGVDAVERGGVSIPGVKAWVEKGVLMR